jgi:hypothetical protein
MPLNETIQRLRAVILDANCQYMNKSTVVGFLGEVLVCEKLRSEGLDVTHLGNQKGYDLQITSLTPEIRIDVKTAVGSDIQGKMIRTWGWALLSTTKKRPLTCTHFVCVALDCELHPFAYHVIERSRVTEFPPSAGQFKSVIHAYAAHHPNNPFSVGTTWYDQHDKSELLFRSGAVSLVKPGESLSLAFKNLVKSATPTPGPSCP